jgi:hypothetical protein
MFNIENHPELGLFVYYGDDYGDAYIASVGCCALGVHSFENGALQGFKVCECCGQIEAVFALHDSVREDGAGAIFATVRIEDVREFAGCATLEECERVMRSHFTNESILLAA